MAEQNEAAWIDEPRKLLRVGPADMPTAAGDDEIVVKNQAIAINPVDWKIQEAGLFVEKFPFILGTDVAGECYSVGKNVTRFKKGDRVLGHAISLATKQNRHGGFQLYTAIPAKYAAIIPDNFTYPEAAVLPLAIDTAGQGLYGLHDKGFLGLPYPSLNPQPLGKTILVWGGSSSVGALAIQLATASGVTVVAVSSKHNDECAKKLGAVEALDYKEPTIVDDAVWSVQTAGGEFVGIYDAIANDDSFKFVFPIAEKLGGTNIAGTLPQPANVPERVKYGQIFAINDVNNPIWNKYVTPALEEGKLLPMPAPLVVGNGLGSVQKGMNANKAGVSAKKIIVGL